jgi:hypothetical protein
VDGEAAGVDGGAVGTDGAAAIVDNPFECTLVSGILHTQEWFNAGFETQPGIDDSKWEGKFQHYGYIDIWSQDPPSGFAWAAPIISPCAKSSDAPDRVIFTAWDWEVTDEQMYADFVVQDVNQFRKYFPSIKRMDLLTIVRCPGNKMCNPNAQVPPIEGVTDKNAGQQDCYVAPYVDAALAKAAAQFPGLVFVGPRFESPACASPVNGAHFYMYNPQIAAEIAAYYTSTASLSGP